MPVLDEKLGSDEIDVEGIDDRLGAVVCGIDRDVELAEDEEVDKAVLIVVLLAIELPGLLEPPYVHPSPRGIDGP